VTDSFDRDMPRRRLEPPPNYDAEYRQATRSETEITFFDDRAIYTTTKHEGQDVYYVPFVACDGRVGYAVRTNPDNTGRESNPIDQVETFIYLNPSTSDDGEDEPNVFVYQGGENDPALDVAEHYYTIEWD
jgi:hypothetical protein